MKRTNQQIDDGPDAGRLSTTDYCLKAAAYCYKRASRSLFDSDRDRWFELAARNHNRADVLARGDA